MTMATFLLAAVGDVLPILFVLVAIATGIINYFREKSAAEQAKLKRNRRQTETRRDEEMDNDIDMFLEEVSGGDERPRRKRPQRKRPRPPGQRRPKRKRPAQEREESQERRQSVAERHMESGVGQRHVQSSVSGRHVESSVENRHLESNVGTAGVAERRSRAMAASPIAKMLKSSDGVRTAIILNEILSPPPGRRK